MSSNWYQLSESERAASLAAWLCLTSTEPDGLIPSREALERAFERLRHEAPTSSFPSWESLGRAKRVMSSPDAFATAWRRAAPRFASEGPLVSRLTFRLPLPALTPGMTTEAKVEASEVLHSLSTLEVSPVVPFAESPLAAPPRVAIRWPLRVGVVSNQSLSDFRSPFPFIKVGTPSEAYPSWDVLVVDRPVRDVSRGLKGVTAKFAVVCHADISDAVGLARPERREQFDAFGFAILDRGLSLDRRSRDVACVQGSPEQG